MRDTGNYNMQDAAAESGALAETIPALASSDKLPLVGAELLSIRRSYENVNPEWLSKGKRGYCQSHQKSNRKNTRRIQAHQCIQMQYFPLH